MKWKPLRQRDLGAYLDEEVYPALYERLDAAFPEFGWRRRGHGWTASVWPPAFPYPVEHKSPDRLMVYENRPYWIKLHGHEGVRLLDYVNGGHRPQGPEFVEAVRQLCELAGVPFPEREVSGEDEERIRRRDARRSALEALGDYCKETLWSPRGSRALEYIRARGLRDEDIRELALGYYASAAEARKYLLDAGVPEQDSREFLGENLEGYLTFPWADAAGQPLNLYGRWPAKTSPDGKPKTMSLRGEGTKAAPLYFDRARRAGHRELVAVEGLLDAALLQARGDLRVVAYSGAQFSGAQVETLARYGIRKVVLVPDPDGAGEEGAEAMVSSLAAHGIPAYVAPPLPDGLDPDEFVLREGLEAWHALVRRAVPGTVYGIISDLRDVTPDSPSMARHEAVGAVLGRLERLRGLGAALDRDEALELLAARTGFTREALAEEAGNLEERRRRADRERDLDALLEEARTARAEGKSSALEVAVTLSRELATLQARDIDTPPTFSVDRLERESRERPAGKTSGWERLDRLEVRFHAGELALMAARTGHGKTSALVALLLNWLKAPERDPDEQLVFYSSEEPEVRVYHRLLAALTGETHEGWSANQVRDFLRDRDSRGDTYEWPFVEFLEEARNRLRSWESSLQVVHRPAWSVDEIAAHAVSLSNRRPIGAVLVDYLQRIPAPAGTRAERRDIEVSNIARRLHGLAGEVSAPVVAAAQINREAVPDKYREALQKAKSYEEAKRTIQKARPELHHLREGGSEQEADLVLGLLNYAADYRETDETAAAVPDITRFEVGTLKTRYGTPGRWAALAFKGRYGVLRDPVREDEV